MENMIAIALLKQHVQNTQIYGEEDVKDLADKIKESKWIRPIVINNQNIILSGHRRVRACKSIGIKDVPYERVSFENENLELERLLLENEYREKSTYQKMQEGKMWEEIYLAKAKEKMSLGGKGKENFPTLEKGQTRDLVAEKIDIGSGKTYDSAKKVVKKIEELKAEGNEKDSTIMKIALNESVNGATNLAKTDLSKVNEELKDKIINKEITVKEAIKEIKKEAESLSVCVEPLPKLEDEQVTVSVVNESTYDKLQIMLDAFVNSIKKYSKMDDELEEIPDEDKTKIINSIGSLEEILVRIKGLLM